MFTNEPKDTAKETSKLAIAAEELIKATYSHVEASTLNINNVLQKLSMDSASVEKSIVDLKDHLNSRLKILYHTISDQAKDDKLRWAFDNAGFNSFEYFEKGCNYALDSIDLVRNVIIWFRKGCGRYIDGCAMKNYKYLYQNGESKESEKEFREALRDQIFDLIGVKPVFENDVIYYSK